jgi:hypothetical protein
MTGCRFLKQLSNTTVGNQRFDRLTALRLPQCQPGRLGRQARFA